jgi:hypothetical protein
MVYLEFVDYVPPAPAAPRVRREEEDVEAEVPAGAAPGVTG